MPVNKKNCVKLKDPMNMHRKRRSPKGTGELRRVTEEAFVRSLNQVKKTEANEAGIKRANNNVRVAHQSPINMNGNNNIANV